MEEITAANNPEETVTESPENGNDSPETEPESVSSEDAQPADACKNADCPFYDTDCEHNCQGRAEFQQCPGCVKDAVESCHCKNVNLLDIYNKLMEAEDHE